ncbi:MAG: ABC transporter permease [Chloroflexi bacterium]|nr:ABC transporter permease [Chloroflexota bacterium]
MRNYIARRVLLSIPTLIGATLLCFLILRVIPGDVAEMILEGEGGGLAQPRSVEILREELGLNRPLHVQYLTWVWNSIRGDFGTSLQTGRSVGGEFALRLPLTIEIALGGLFLGVITGIPLGILSAIKQDSWIDYVGRVMAILFLSIPGFWIGVLVLLIGVRSFNWMPPIGYNPIWANPITNILQFMWPILILGLHQTAIKARLTRSQMLEVMREDYIRTARAKGLAEHVVIWRHTLKNALIPVVTIVFIQLGHVFAGTVILEAVFNVSGMGTLFIEAIRFRDYTIVQGYLFIIAVSFLVFNIIADLVYGWLDPRISYS